MVCREIQLHYLNWGVQVFSQYQACNPLGGCVDLRPFKTNRSRTLSKMSDWLKNTYLPSFKNLSEQVSIGLDNVKKIQLQPVTFDLSSLGTVITKLWEKVTSWFSWPSLATWVAIGVGILVVLVVIKCLLDRLMQTQQQVRLTAMAAMQLADGGPTARPAAAYLLRVAEHRF